MHEKKIMTAISSPPLPLFFPLGVVKVYDSGVIEPVLDPDCRHSFQCVLKCYSSLGWRRFVSKLVGVCVPTSKQWRLSIRSYENPTFEVASVWCDVKGQVFTKNKYEFV